MNIDGSGLKIHIPVLKRKREKGSVEYSSISTLKTHYYRGITEEAQAKRSRMKPKCNKRPTTVRAGEEQHLESDKKKSVLIQGEYVPGGD